MDITLVTGGTGKTGRRVAERLTGPGRGVRLGSRSAFFAQNVSETFWLDAVRAGELTLPGNAGVPIVGILDGHNGYLSDGIRRALGREPRDLSGFVRRTAKTGVWDG